jgi:hypothetical protein
VGARWRRFVWSAASVRWGCLSYRFMIAEKPLGRSKWIVSHVPPLSVLHVFLWSFQSAAWHSANAEPLEDARRPVHTHTHTPFPQYTTARQPVHLLASRFLPHTSHPELLLNLPRSCMFSGPSGSITESVKSPSLSGTVGVYSSTRRASCFGKPVPRTSCVPDLSWIPK